MFVSLSAFSNVFLSTACQARLFYAAVMDFGFFFPCLRAYDEMPSKELWGLVSVDRVGAVAVSLGSRQH